MAANRAAVGQGAPPLGAGARARCSIAGREGGGAEELGLGGWAEEQGRKEWKEREDQESKKIGEADMWAHGWVVGMEYEI
jgi:hypothetical protein